MKCVAIVSYAQASELESYSLEACGLLALIGLIFAGIFGIDQSQGIMFYPASLIAIAIFLSIFVVPLRYILVPFAIILLPMPDLTQTPEEVQEFGTIVSASLWQLTPGFVSPAITALISLLVALARVSRVSPVKLHTPFLMYFFFVAVAISLVMGFIGESLGRVFADAKVPVFLYLSLIFFESYFRKFPEETLRSAQVVLMLWCGTQLFEVMRYAWELNQIGETSRYVNLSLDSAKGITLGIAFYSISKLIRMENSILWATVLFATLYLIFAYQTRWLILTFVAGIFVVFLLYPVSRRLIFLVWLCPLAFIGIYAMAYFESEAFRIMMLRLSFLADIGFDTQLVEIDLVRAGSIINSLNTLWQNNTIFTGMSYGSWYTDQYLPMYGLTVGAFDKESLTSGRFYRIHDFFFHFLFKYGVFGLSIYLSVFLLPLRRLWKNRKFIVKCRFGTEILAVLLGLSPTVITYMWFSSKSVILCGLYIAFCTAFYAAFKNQWVFSQPHSNNSSLISRS